jgi:exodeoxyribonuclease VII large subunit
MKIQALSVTDIVSQVKQSLESQYRAVVVQGEVSNLSGSAAGHWYFTLSDGQSSISCALFKMDAYRNPIIKKIKNGDQVLITVHISVYTRK